VESNLIDFVLFNQVQMAVSQYAREQVIEKSSRARTVPKTQPRAYMTRRKSCNAVKLFSIAIKKGKQLTRI